MISSVSGCTHVVVVGNDLGRGMMYGSDEDVIGTSVQYIFAEGTSAKNLTCVFTNFDMPSLIFFN
jgi:hypothetical protein